MATIIFDFDGTIADTTKYFFEMANEVAERFNYPAITKDQFERARGVAPRQMLKELKIPIRALPKLRKASHATFEARMNDIELIPGMREVVIELSKEHTLGILTSNDADLVHTVLKRLDLDNEFDFINSAVNILGKHRALNKIVKRRDFKREETIYIGDEVRDIEGAKKAKLNVVSVTWGFNTKDLLQSYNPTVIFTKPSQITEYVKKSF